MMDGPLSLTKAFPHPRSPVTRGRFGWITNYTCGFIAAAPPDYSRSQKKNKKRQVRARSPSNWPSKTVRLHLDPHPNHTILGSPPAAVMASHHVHFFFPRGRQQLHLHYSHVNCSSRHAALFQPVEHNQLPPVAEKNGLLMCVCLRAGDSTGDREKHVGSE